MEKLKCRKYEMLGYEVYLMYSKDDVQVFTRPSGFVEDCEGLIFLCAANKNYKKIYGVNEYGFALKELSEYLEEEAENDNR